MNSVNRKIIDAVIARAERVCPDSLALIGVYGSVATGDEYPGSDLDLLIFIKDDAGWQLGSGFILDDSGIGYDIYCVNRNVLNEEAKCRHSQLARLLDSKIVYVKDEAAHEELLRLREQARELLQSDTRFERAEEQLAQARAYYAEACLRDDPGRVRMNCAGVILSVLSAVMFFHGRYFRRGTKRTFDELSQLPLDQCFYDYIRRIPLCTDISGLRALAKQLIIYTEQHVSRPRKKAAPASENIAGTYEEMYSNWRNKVQEAADRGDVYSSFMNICFLQNMIDDIAAGTEIGTYDLPGSFDGTDLQHSAAVFDSFLAGYEKVYEQAGIKVVRYADVDEFVADYTKGE